jgi:DNA polymerase III sliding clamp (beta) subunit (PCNA family)
MQFIVKRDILLKSLNFVQGIVEKKKYASNTFKCFVATTRQ